MRPSSDFCVRKNPSAYYALVRSFSVAERFAERKRSVISDLAERTYKNPSAYYALA